MILKKLQKAFSAILILSVLATVIATVINTGTRRGYAATTSVQTAYEAQNVLEDLRDATIDGKGVDFSVYSFDNKKNAQIISFVEFCYSYRPEKQNEYGLYVYVYNPRGYNFTKNQDLNRIELRAGGNAAAPFVKYPLSYLNRSEKAGYEGLFYKFKIVLTQTQRKAVLSALNSGRRVYEVCGIELYNAGINATEYEVSNTYTYTGYTKGYGSDDATGDTLTCTSDGLMTLSLDVHSAFYRPEYANNDKTDAVRDTLHSVYFTVPNKVLEEYGALSAVHASWLNAVTDYALVTGDYDAYEAVKKYIGVHISEFTSWNGQNYGERPQSDLKYRFGYRMPDAIGMPMGWSYCLLPNMPFMSALTPLVGVQERLNYLFFSGDYEDSADSYTVSSAEISKWLVDYTEKYGGELVLGKYSKALFESVDDDFTDKNITAGNSFTLTSIKFGKDFLEKWFGGQHVVSEVFENIEAIHEVTDEDIKISPARTCQALYIDESDYKEFKSVYDKAKNADETVFLFRYQVSDYRSFETTVHRPDGTQNTNAYVFKQTVNLDFDIIDVTCNKGKVKTVIPCIMSPQDIIYNAAPPLSTSSDKKVAGLPVWAWIVIAAVAAVAAIAAVILICVFVPGALPVIGKALLAVLKAVAVALKWLCIGLAYLLYYLLYGLWRIVCAPVKLIANAVKARKDKRAATAGTGRTGNSRRSERKTKPKKQKARKPHAKTKTKKAGKRK